jgi:hypothetical protein
MSKKRKSYSADFKQDAVSRMAHAKTITGLARSWGFDGSFFVFGGTNCRREAGRRWSGAEDGLRIASRGSFPNWRPVRPSCGSPNYNGFWGRKQEELDFFKRTFEGAAAIRISDGGKGSIAASKPHSHSKE